MNKKKSKLRGLLIWLGSLALIALVIFGIYVYQKMSAKASTDITKEELQAIVDKTVAELPNSSCKGSVFVAENTTVTIDSFKFGNNMDIILDCTYKTLDVKGTLMPNTDDIVAYAYSIYATSPEGMRSETLIMAKSINMFTTLLADAPTVEGKITLTLYETSKGVFTPYLDYKTVNTIYGGMIEVSDKIVNTNSTVYEGETVDLVNNGTVRKGAAKYLGLDNYDSKKPDTSVPIEKLWNSIKYDFNRNFIEKDRYMTLLRGLSTTLQIAAIAALMGIAIGFVIAVIRCINQKTDKIGFLAGICKAYISVMRGTPLVVQLLIMHYVVLAPLNLPAFNVAIICFGLNSGAYVSEIVRGGIMSIDNGQTEAGRSLGFNYIQTMWYIIIPQAFKAVLPSLANEFITLLKETSVAFVISVADLSNAGDRIRAATFSPFMPLIAVAIIYLVLVLGLSKLVAILERRLAKSDRR